MNPRVEVLHCLRCEVDYPPDSNLFLCPRCGPGDDIRDPGVLDVRYDYDGAGFGEPETVGIFRYRELLPIREAGPIPLTGATPLISAPRLAARLGLAQLYLKDERRNATQCLKDRATAIAVSFAAAADRSDLYCASAGNAAISLAGYCAYAGFRAHVFVPFDASPVRLEWLRRFAADIRISRGNYDQAFAESEEMGDRLGWYSRNCAFNPFLVEGKKTVSFEIAEQLGWQTPDWVVAPVGDGCTLGAIGKGFRELNAIGRTGGLPRLLGAQASGMQPMVRRMNGGTDKDSGETTAASIKVRRPRNALRLLHELRASDGRMVAVTDEATGRAQRWLAEEAGMVVEFTSATALAGLAELTEKESLGGATAVAVITGGRVD
jgi:threonine synthase